MYLSAPNSPDRGMLYIELNSNDRRVHSDRAKCKQVPSASSAVSLQVFSSKGVLAKRRMFR